MLLPLPSERVPWRDPRLRGAWLVLGVAVALSVAVFPYVIVNGDEYYYAGEAFTLSRGRALPVPGDPLPAPPSPPAEAMKYPLGWPLLLAPARLVSFRALFVVALAVHLAGCAAVARMLVRRGVRSELVALYVFHPVLWLYSRTLMSDVPAAALTVVAMDLWEDGRTRSSALALAYSTTIRVASAFTAVGFLLALAMGLPERRRETIRFAVWLAFLAAVLIGTQYALTGPGRGSGYARGYLQLFTGTLWAENLLLYSCGLALLPPFSLVLAAAVPRRVDRWAISALPVAAFFVVYSFHDTGRSLLETLVGGQRFVVPVHAVLFLATAGIWGKWLARWSSPAVAASAMVALAISTSAQRLEAPYRPAVQAATECSPATVGYNIAAGRVAGSVEAREYHSFDDTGAGRQVDLYVFASRPLSNRPGAGTWNLDPPGDLVSRSRQTRRVGEFALYDVAGVCPSGWGVPVR